MTRIPSIDDIEYVKEVPAKGHPFAESAWLPVLEMIKKAHDVQREVNEPVTPAVVGRYDTDREANSVAGNLRSVTSKRGKWEIVNRQRAVYVTYLGGWE